MGSMEGWHAGEATAIPAAGTPTTGTPAAETATPQGAPSAAAPERTPAQRAEDAARLAWYQRDKPPHWG